MVTKISEAAMIAKLGIDVYIAKVKVLIISPDILLLFFIFQFPYAILPPDTGSNKSLIAGTEWRTEKWHS